MFRLCECDLEQICIFARNSASTNVHDELQPGNQSSPSINRSTENASLHESPCSSSDTVLQMSSLPLPAVCERRICGVVYHLLLKKNPSLPRILLWQEKYLLRLTQSTKEVVGSGASISSPPLFFLKCCLPSFLARLLSVCEHHPSTCLMQADLLSKKMRESLFFLFLPPCVFLPLF